MSQNDALIAVLIDSDNISASYLDAMINEIAKYGVTSIKRIYGDWTRPQLANWRSKLQDYAISPVQQFSYTSGKNATDSALIIDAMDMLYTSKVDTYFLVSSDSDFTKLAIRLREAGKQVIGMGETKTPTSFIAACNRFFYLEMLKIQQETDLQEQEDEMEEQLDNLSDTALSEPVAGKKMSKWLQFFQHTKTSDEMDRGLSEKMDEHLLDKKSSSYKNEISSSEGKEEAHSFTDAWSHSGSGKRSLGIKRVEKLVIQTIQDLEDEDGYAFLGDVGNLLLKKDPAFDSRNYGYSKLSVLIRDLPGIEVDERPTSNPAIKHIYIKVKNK